MRWRQLSAPYMYGRAQNFDNLSIFAGNEFKLHQTFHVQSFELPPGIHIHKHIALYCFFLMTQPMLSSFRKTWLAVTIFGIHKGSRNYIVLGQISMVHS